MKVGKSGDLRSVRRNISKTVEDIAHIITNIGIGIAHRLSSGTSFDDLNDVERL